MAASGMASLVAGGPCAECAGCAGFASLAAHAAAFDAWIPVPAVAGDPTPLGWTVTIGYAVAAYAAWRARTAGVRSAGERRFWVALAGALLLLAFNKQLDLQIAVTRLARDFAKEGGWYRERKTLQVALSAAALLAATGAFAWVAWRLRAARARVWPALAGLALLAAYVALRLVSLHAVDAWLRAGPIPARDLAEPFALALVLAGALRRPRAVAGRGGA
ncbi:MAG: hypothetical protein RI967_480 [Planctomycetota bacterium]